MAATAYKPISYEFEILEQAEMVRRGRQFSELMTRRRSVRDFSTETPPRECLELAIRTAASAPSGAHRQPWKFVIVDDPALQQAIREPAEAGSRCISRCLSAARRDERVSDHDAKSADHSLVDRFVGFCGAAFGGAGGYLCARRG